MTQSYPCPCCHKLIENSLRAIDLADYARFTLHEKKTLDCLIQGTGRLISFEFLAEQVWGDREDGGPLCVNNAMKVNICSLRKKIAGSGWRINSIWGIGFRLELESQDSISKRPIRACAEEPAIL